MVEATTTTHAQNDAAHTAANSAESPVEWLFFDGNCGLCHRWVKFVLRYDEKTEHFHFAPLHGETFNEHVSADLATNLPDSIVVLDQSNQLLTRSDAIIHIMRRIGGGWGVMGAIVGIIPRFLRDFGYNSVAKVRHRLFKPPAEACPLMPVHLRGRFRF